MDHIRSPSGKWRTESWSKENYRNLIKQIKFTKNPLHVKLDLHQHSNQFISASSGSLGNIWSISNIKPKNTCTNNKKQMQTLYSFVSSPSRGNHKHNSFNILNPLQNKCHTILPDQEHCRHWRSASLSWLQGNAAQTQRKWTVHQLQAVLPTDKQV